MEFSVFRGCIHSPLELSIKATNNIYTDNKFARTTVGQVQNVNYRYKDIKRIQSIIRQIKSQQSSLSLEKTVGLHFPGSAKINKNYSLIGVTYSYLIFSAELLLQPLILTFFFIFHFTLLVGFCKCLPSLSFTQITVYID